MAFKGTWFEIKKTCSCGHDVQFNTVQCTYEKRHDRYVFQVACANCYMVYEGHFRMEKKPVEVEA